ncbi:hypothetical protein T484DRAFT_1833568 [Baffinella frigidus]|nr:hypothetical protein T484DRAFT_1833568 [Cryptophyta sp. CCMP2293]
MRVTTSDGYLLELHRLPRPGSVTTSDGYLLELHRLPRPGSDRVMFLQDLLP